MTSLCHESNLRSRDRGDAIVQVAAKEPSKSRADGANTLQIKRLRVRMRPVAERLVKLADTVASGFEGGGALLHQAAALELDRGANTNAWTFVQARQSSNCRRKPHKNVSEFLLDAGVTAAAQTLADRRQFVLDDAQWQAFHEALGKWL